MNGGTEWGERFNSSVRGLIALIFTLAYCWRFVTGYVDDSLFSNILAGIVAYWFAQKAAEKMLQSVQSQAPLPGTVTDLRTVTPAAPAAQVVNPQAGGGNVPKV